MTDSGSEDRFVERDNEETKLGYGDGRLPLYIGIVWVMFILSYGIVMVILALPDFLAWSNR